MLFGIGIGERSGLSISMRFRILWIRPNDNIAFRTTGLVHKSQLTFFNDTTRNSSVVRQKLNNLNYEQKQIEKKGERTGKMEEIPNTVLIEALENRLPPPTIIFHCHQMYPQETKLVKLDPELQKHMASLVKLTLFFLQLTSISHQNCKQFWSF